MPLPRYRRRPPRAGPTGTKRRPGLALEALNRPSRQCRPWVPAGAVAPHPRRRRRGLLPGRDCSCALAAPRNPTAGPGRAARCARRPLAATGSARPSTGRWPPLPRPGEEGPPEAASDDVGSELLTLAAVIRAGAMSTTGMAPVAVIALHDEAAAVGEVVDACVRRAKLRITIVAKRPGSLVAATAAGAAAASAPAAGAGAAAAAAARALPELLVVPALLVDPAHPAIAMTKTTSAVAVRAKRHTLIVRPVRLTTQLPQVNAEA